MKEGARPLRVQDLADEEGVIARFDLGIPAYGKTIVHGMLGFERALNLAVEKRDRDVIGQMRELCEEGFEKAEAMLAEAEGENS